MKRMITVLALALVLVAIVVATAMPAFAKITLENRGGQEVRGGGATAEGPHTAVNPAGHAPGGHNR